MLWFCFLFRLKSSQHDLNWEFGDEKANIEMPFYEMSTTDEPSRHPTRDRNPLGKIGGKNNRCGFE